MTWIYGEQTTCVCDVFVIAKSGEDLGASKLENKKWKYKKESLRKVCFGFREWKNYAETRTTEDKWRSARADTVSVFIARATV